MPIGGYGKFKLRLKGCTNFAPVQSPRVFLILVSGAPTTTRAASREAASVKSESRLWKAAGLEPADEAGRAETAMATRPAGRSCWELSPAERMPRAGRKKPAEAPESPAVLSLSHFCRSPFLCFGDVRPGTSRTLPLVLQNPNEEVAEVEVAHLPAAELGFSVWPRHCVVQVGPGRAGRPLRRRGEAG